MSIKINITRKIVINGREYGSAEEMPEDLRRTYEKIMGTSAGGGQLPSPTSVLPDFAIAGG